MLPIDQEPGCEKDLVVGTSASAGTPGHPVRLTAYVAHTKWEAVNGVTKAGTTATCSVRNAMISACISQRHTQDVESRNMCASLVLFGTRLVTISRMLEEFTIKSLCLLTVGGSAGQ